jgi:hypothetical protein
MTDTGLPADSPPQPGWTEGQSTNAQASSAGVMHRTYGDDSQIDMSLGDPSDGHVVQSRHFEDQTDTQSIETCTDTPTSFRRTTLLQEKMAGGYTPNTAPVGEGTPAPTSTAGTRGANDTLAIERLRQGQV